MDRDTSIGGPGGRFPDTRASALAGLSSADERVREEAREAIIAAYWKPAYKYFRIKWRQSNEDAKDLTQGFFARLIEKQFFASYDPARSTFRNYVRVCLDGYISNELKAASRQKRGGAAQHLSLDFEDAERELEREPRTECANEEYFQREWTRQVFGRALNELREDLTRRGRSPAFEMFLRYDVQETEQVSYEVLARDFGVPVTTITNSLAMARREFRRQVLAALRAITGGEAEFRREARALLGIDPV